MANELEMMLSTEVELLQAENARLREELAESIMANKRTQDAYLSNTTQLADCREAIQVLARTANDKERELAAAQADAARYRKIRSECGFVQQHFSVAIPTPYTWEVVRTGEELDAAIDAAMKEQS